MIILQTTNSEEKVEAIYLCKKVEDFEVVVMVAMQNKILTTIHIVSKLLQSPQIISFTSSFKTKIKQFNNVYDLAFMLIVENCVLATTFLDLRTAFLLLLTQITCNMISSASRQKHEFSIIHGTFMTLARG
jgi:hypothetical protein